MTTHKSLPFQFTLTTLLASFVAVWSAMTLCGVGIGLWLVAAFLTVLFTWGYVRTRLERFVIVAILAVLGALMLPPVVTDHSAVHAGLCRDRLAAVGRAVQAYHADFGRFPPACVRDGQGRPMHSWRVLILPYLGYDALYQSYDLNEPWDGPNNSLLLTQTPREYECRTMLGWKGGGGVTSCVAVVGPRTVWPDDRPVRDEDLADGGGHTIMIGETAPNLQIQWLEPRDLEFAKAAAGFYRFDWKSNDVVDKLVAAHPLPFAKDKDARAAHVVTADGRVWTLPDDVPPGTLRKLLTLAESEPIDIASLVLQPPSKVSKYLSAVLLVGSLLVVTVSFVRRRRALEEDSHA